MTKYTLESLTAMPDPELNAIAATAVMGWHVEELDAWWYGPKGGVVIPRREYSPATDRNQSGKLLAKMAESGVRFTTHHWEGAEEITGAVPLILKNRRDVFYVPGDGARAETIAAILAAQAIASQEEIAK